MKRTDLIYLGLLLLTAILTFIYFYQGLDFRAYTHRYFREIPVEKNKWPEHVPDSATTQQWDLPPIRTVINDGWDIDVAVNPDSPAVSRLLYKGPALYWEHVRYEQRGDTLFIGLRDSMETVPRHRPYKLRLTTGQIPRDIVLRRGDIKVGRDFRHTENTDFTHDSLTIHVEGNGWVGLRAGDGLTPFPYLGIMASHVTGKDPKPQIFLEGHTQMLDIQYVEKPTDRFNPLPSTVEFANETFVADSARIEWPHTKNCMLQVREYLQANLSGNGNIFLVNGKPAQMQVKCTGRGQVLRAIYQQL